MMNKERTIATVGMRIHVFSPDNNHDWGHGTITKVEPLEMRDNHKKLTRLFENYPSEIILDDGRKTEGLMCWWYPLSKETKNIGEGKECILRLTVPKDAIGGQVVLAYPDDEDGTLRYGEPIYFNPDELESAPPKETGSYELYEEYDGHGPTGRLNWRIRGSGGYHDVEEFYRDDEETEKKG